MLLTIKQCAGRLSVSARTVYLLVNRCLPRAVRIGAGRGATVR